MDIIKCIKCGSDHTELILKNSLECVNKDVSMVDIYLNCHSCKHEEFVECTTENIFILRIQTDELIKHAIINGATSKEIDKIKYDFNCKYKNEQLYLQTR